MQLQDLEKEFRMIVKPRFVPPGFPRYEETYDKSNQTEPSWTMRKGPQARQKLWQDLHDCRQNPHLSGLRAVLKLLQLCTLYNMAQDSPLYVASPFCFALCHGCSYVIIKWLMVVLGMTAAADISSL